MGNKLIVDNEKLLMLKIKWRQSLCQSLQISTTKNRRKLFLKKVVDGVKDSRNFVAIFCLIESETNWWAWTRTEEFIAKKSYTESNWKKNSKKTF